jgi:DNA-binding Lrp family transcriptional regulator
MTTTMHAAAPMQPARDRFLCAQDTLAGTDDVLEFRLLNEFQRGFPLLPRPFRAIAERLGTDEVTVIAMLRGLQERGLVSRVGAVFAPRRIGASTLAAAAVPPAELERAAALVSEHPEVNHNYQREHRCNLWFVATAASEAALQAALDKIEEEIGCRVLSLPLVEEFHIDLGFDLAGGEKPASIARVIYSESACALPVFEQKLIAALQPGLELVSQPFAAVAEKAELSEDMALAMLQDLLASGIVKRFGVVVRHQELGYAANAMCVWDVPDTEVSAIGAKLAAEPAVTLCYRRARAAPDWPYNLFCMIHGRARDEVERDINAIKARLALSAFPHAVLFSTKRFKQCGARYAAPAEACRG